MPPKNKKCECHLCNGAYVDAAKASLHKSWAASAAKKAERERAQMQELEHQTARLALTNSTCTVSNRMWGRDDGDVTRGDGTTFAADDGGNTAIPVHDREGKQGGVSKDAAQDELLTELTTLDFEVDKRITLLDPLIVASTNHADVKLLAKVEDEATWLSEMLRRLDKVKTGGNPAVGVMTQAMSDRITKKVMELDSWRKAHGPTPSSEDVIDTGICIPHVLQH